MLIRIIILACLGSFLHAQINSKQSLVPVKENKLWGFIDSTGQMLISPKYDLVDEFDTLGYCVVEVNEKVGIIDLSGNFLIPAEFDLVKVIDRGIFMVKQQGNWEIRNNTNKVLINNVGGNILTLGFGYFSFEKVSGFGFGHIERGLISEAKYSSIKLCSDTNYIEFGQNSKKGLLRTDGSLLLEANFDDFLFFKKALAAKKDKHFALFDLEGKAFCGHDYEKFSVAGNNFIIAMNKNRSLSNLFSISEKKIIHENISSATQIDSLCVLVKINYYLNKLINNKGINLLDSTYRDVREFAGDLFMVSTDNDKWGLHKIGADTALIKPQFDLIEAPKGSVAKIMKDSLFGIINRAGEITLAPTLKDFSIENNSIKIKDKNSLKIMVFNEAGYFEDQSEFNNFKTLRIDGSSLERNSNLANRLPSLRDQLELNDSLIWQIGNNGKFGIFNKKTKKFVVQPTYRNFINYPEIDLSLAEVYNVGIGGQIPVNSANATVNSAWVIVNNVIGRPVSKAVFIHIDMNDIIKDSLPLARCVFAGGKHGLINKKGKVILAGMTYIGKFCEGRAICTKSGYLSLDLKDKQKNHLGTASNFFSKMICSYEFDGFGIDHIRKNNIYCEEGEWGYLDTLGKWVIDGSKNKYEHAVDFSNNRAMVRKNNKWGLIDENGKVILPFQYDDMNFIQNSDKKLYYVNQYQQKFGYVNKKAEFVVPVKYDKIREFREDRLALKKGSYWGFADEEGNEIIPCKFRSVNDFKEDLAAVSEKGKWGYIDKSGNYVIAATFSKAANFSEGFAWVQLNNGKMVFIDKSGKVAIDLGINNATDFKNGLASAFIREKGWGVIDSAGNWVIKPKKQWMNISEFNAHGLAKVRINKAGYAIINRKGEVLSKAKYDEISTFSEGFAVVRRKGFSEKGSKLNSAYGLIDTNGRETVKATYQKIGPVKNGLAMFCSQGNYGYLSPEGKIKIAAQFYLAEDFQEGKAIVFNKHNLTGIIDTVGNFIIAPNVSKIMEISEGLALVKSAYSSFYFLGEDLQRQNSENFVAAKNYADGVAPVCYKNNWTIINTRGIKLSTEKFQQIDAFKNGFAKVKLCNRMGVVDSDGKIVIEPEYEYVSYAGNGLFRVEKQNSLGYLNNKGEWVWKLKN
jgi:hypothetical protein